MTNQSGTAVPQVYIYTPSPEVGVSCKETTASFSDASTSIHPLTSHQSRDKLKDQPYVVTICNGTRKVSLTAQNTGAMLHTHQEYDKVRKRGVVSRFLNKTSSFARNRSSRINNMLIPSDVITDTPPSSLWCIDGDPELDTVDKSSPSYTYCGGKAIAMAMYDKLDYHCSELRSDEV